MNKILLTILALSSATDVLLYNQSKVYYLANYTHNIKLDKDMNLFIKEVDDELLNRMDGIIINKNISSNGTNIIF